MKGNLKLLLVLMVALGAAGGWNYHRNVTAEAGEPRPYAGYSDADLEALIAAYESEVGTLERSYAAAKTVRGDSRAKGHFDDQVREFERVQGISNQKRRAGVKLSVGEAELTDLRAEQARRERDADPFQVFLRRLLTI